jgi:glycosyltransferase involved in cell wall biosynthesis
MNKKVSILIPVYNREKLIERTLDSALKQSYPNIEIIVNDNQSTDNTWEVLQAWSKKDSRIKIFQNEKNFGPVYNWNAALKHCNGEYLKVLYSDDTIEAECITECVKVLEANPQTGLVFTSAMIHLKDRDIPAYHHPSRLEFPVENFTLDTIMNRNLPVSPGCTLIRRKDAFFSDFKEATPKLHEIAKTYGAGPDVFYILHAASKYPKIAHIPRFLSHFYGGEDSFTLANRKEVSLGYKLAYKHMLKTDPFISTLRKKVKINRFKDNIKKALSKIF